MSQEVNLVEAVASCQEDQVTQRIREKIDAGVPAKEILAECNAGMIELGDRFGRDEAFLPDLMFGGMIMKGVMEQLGPLLSDAGQDKKATRATTVIGTVRHDVHDIGKDIVVMLLRGAGFEVIDLGIDAAPAKFVEAIRQHKPAVVGLSLLLTTCFKEVAATVDAIKEAGLRDGVSVMVGGAAASQLLSEKSGCDFYGKTAVDGLNFACQVTEG